MEDTAVANHLLSEDSRSWGSLRRDQDYYEEGLLLWMEADAILRNLSEGRRSLDDFCKTFLGPHASPSRSVGYDIGELTKTLNELASYDWDKFFHDWVKVPQDALPLSVVGRLGYRLQYSSKPSEHPRKNGAARNIISALASIGLAFGEDGKVLSVIPRMAGDEAGLAPGMMIVGVNSRKFNEERLRDAIAETVSRRQLEFLILEGDVVSTIVLPDADGLKYLELVRDGHGPDILKRILEPGLNEP